MIKAVKFKQTFLIAMALLISGCVSVSTERDASPAGSREIPFVESVATYLEILEEHGMDIPDQIVAVPAYKGWRFFEGAEYCGGSSGPLSVELVHGGEMVLESEDWGGGDTSVYFDAEKVAEINSVADLVFEDIANDIYTEGGYRFCFEYYPARVLVIAYPTGCGFGGGIEYLVLLPELEIVQKIYGQ